MSERAKQIASDALRWTGEALQEWAEAVSEYPVAHVFTLFLGMALAVVARWFL